MKLRLRRSIQLSARCYYFTQQRKETQRIHKTSFAIFAPSRDVFQQLSILQIIKNSPGESGDLA